MTLAPFFERVYGSVGGHLAVSRESLEASLGKITAGVRCGKKMTLNDLWISEFVTNITARLYPRLSISGSESQVSELKDLALSINPNMEFADEAPGLTSISIGSGGEEESIMPCASGWVASLGNSSGRLQGPENPYAAGAAGALACAELFRRIFLNTPSKQNISLSLLDFGSETGASLELKPETVGDVAFVGVGAIGNAAIWALARDKRTKGRLWLIDSEQMTLSNLQRYVLGKYADISQPKVELAKRALQAAQFATESCAVQLEQFASARGGMDVSTICISVDNVEARRSAQALLPKLIINGWTGDRALGTSWHVFSRDAACLACLYHPHGPGVSATEQAARALGLSVERAALLWITRRPLSDDDFKTIAQSLGVDISTLGPWRGKSLGDLYTDVVCGSVPLDVTGIGRIETVPLAHQSALAGVLMAAELLKRTIPELEAIAQSEPLVSWDDILRAPPTNWLKPRPREEGCICKDSDYQQVYSSKWDSRSPSAVTARSTCL